MDRRAAAIALVLTFVAVLPGCAQQNYRNYRVPELAAPGADATGESDRAVPLRGEDTVLLRRGLRLIRADVARETPFFSLIDDRGIVHTPESLRGRVVWVDLWAVWCGTCRAEFPFVQKMHERFAGNGLTVLAVCRNSKRSSFEKASRKDWIDFPMVDASDDDEFPFPYYAFPTSVLIDREGRIRAYWQGHRSAEAIEDALRHLLAESGESAGGGIGVRGVAGVPGVPGGAGDALIADPQDLPPGGTSENVLRADLTLPRGTIAAGGYFEGMITLDVDPGWHLNSDSGEGFIPLDLRFDSADGFESLGHHLPAAQPVNMDVGSPEGHSGRLQLPIWGVLEAGLTPGQAVPLTIVATVQACDRSRCLPPAEIVLASRLWISDAGETR